MKNKILLFLLTITAFRAAGQSFELRLANAGNGVIAVEMRETSNRPPKNSDIMTDLVFGICWDKNYNIDLGAVTTNYTIRKAGPETVSGELEYQQFAKDPTPMNLPSTWGASQWVTIMTIPNNLASSQATGNFAVCPVALQELNINYNLVDYPVAAAGNATGIRIGSVLPKNLKLFSATLGTALQVDLEWQITSDLPLVQYELEHSIDGTVFTKFATVPAKGSNPADFRYTYTHKAHPGGANYYRLKLIQTGGRFEYSPVRIIQLERNNEWTLTPNPSTGQFTVNLEAAKEEDLQLTVVDVSGKTIFQDIIGVHPGPNNHFMRLVGVSAGMYQLKIRWSDGETQAKNLFIVE